MKLQQLSLFLENRPGQLREPVDVLANAGIDLLTMSLADTAQFGILRFIDDGGLGVEYMYDFGAASRAGKAAIVFRFEEPDRAVATLQAAGVKLFEAEELLGG